MGGACLETADALIAAKSDPLDIWIRGQRLAAGAALLSTGRFATSLQRVVFEGAGWSRTLSTKVSEPVHVAELMTLPPAALAALNALDPKVCAVFSGHRPYWRQAMAMAKWTGGRSPLAGARLIANRLIAGALSPQQLLRVAKLELGVTWREEPPLIEALAQLMKALRTGRGAKARIEALRMFRERAAPARWGMVENALLQQAFSWPLLILPDEGGKKIYCSLPIDIDVSFASDGSARVESNDFLDATPWNACASVALQAAKDLWDANHSAWEPDFREQIRTASVVINFDVAGRIVAPLLEPWGQWLCDGDSLEAYLALVILGKFLGSPAMESVCATGSLGSRDPDVQGVGADYDICDVGGVPQKIAGAQSAFFFDQVLVPLGQAPESRAERLKVSEGATLQEYAHHVFGDEWRRHRWVRCADIANGFKKAEGIAEQVELVRDALRKNKEPVLRLGSEIQPASVAQALYDINRAVADVYHLKRKPFERQGSYVFVRAVPKERGERFWRVVWDAIAGDPTDFGEFSTIVSATVPGHLLAEQLNRFRPTPTSPTRAPDVLVIFGADLLNAPTAMPLNPFARLQIDGVTTAAGARDPLKKHRLQQTPIIPLRQFLGKTRIILVPKAGDEIPEGRPATIDDDLRDAWRRLSIFRGGFTFQIARKMLKLPDRDCQDLLRRLQSADLPGGATLGYGVTAARGVPPDAAYEYFLRRKVRPVQNDSVMGRLHWDAANAIVGFLERSIDLGRFDFAEALSPVWLHEAQHHLSEAWRRRVGGKGSAIGLSSARERIFRIGEPLAWSTIRWAATYSRELGPEMLTSVRGLLENKLRRRLLVHPVEFIWAAKLANALVDPEKQADPYETHRRSMLAHAWDTADGFPRERDACRFAVLTTRSTLALKAQPYNSGVRKAANDIAAARALLPTTREIIDFEWFEYVADSIDDDREAAELYRMGFWNETLVGAEELSGGAGLVKYLGATHRAGQSPPPEIWTRIKAELPPGTLKYVRAALDRPPSGLREKERVIDRWRVGRNQIIQSFSAGPPQR